MSDALIVVDAADEPGPPRLYAVLLGGFAAFALLIVVIGLFGGLVASVIATAENTSRKPRSKAMASNPVFLSSRFLNAWTE